MSGLIEIKKFTFNPFQENTYILWNTQNMESMIVDPGCFNIKEKRELADFVDKNQLEMKYLINTHCHIDHVVGNRFVKNKYEIPFYAPELDIPLLENLYDQAKLYGLRVEPSPLPDHYITEELELNLGNSFMTFLFTPGHTPGEYCVLFEDENICLSGDVLFHQGIGRTDLYGGDYNNLMDSIKNKLFVLKDDLIVYPGHGDKTTIGFEKQNNPFFR